MSLLASVLVSWLINFAITLVFIFYLDKTLGVDFGRRMPLLILLSLAMRNAVSPMTRARMNLELILGHISTGLIVWALYIFLFVILYKYDFSAAHINLMMVNALIFTISAGTMAVFISSLISNENTISGIMQVVSLGSSFLCGAFVPQALLSKTALTLGKIFPSYYYIKNNEMVLENPNFGTILPNIGMMLTFSLVSILISMGMKTKVKDKIS